MSTNTQVLQYSNYLTNLCPWTLPRSCQHPTLPLSTPHPAPTNISSCPYQHLTLIYDLAEAGEEQLEYLLAMAVMVRVVRGAVCGSHPRLPDVLAAVQGL